MNRHERRKQLKSKKRNNNTVNGFLLDGIKQHMKRNYQEAENLYNKALLREPANYEALRHLGILNQDLENYEKAYNYFISAIKTNPNGFQIRMDLSKSRWISSYLNKSKWISGFPNSGPLFWV